VVLAALVGALVAGLLTAGGFLLLGDRADDGGIASGGADVRALLERVQPSVVSISTGRSTTSTTADVFGGPGSGVIISEDGLVLTNAHVVDGAPRVDLTLHDGRTETATLVGSLPDNDIALLRIDEPVGLVPAELGSSADLQVGDDVVVIGNALNLGGLPSVTQGIVSAKDRVIQAPGGLVLEDLVQTDAAINLGNSGGAMVDHRGRLVGIPTAVIDDAQSVGFAIAIDAVKPLIADIEAGRGAITPDSAFLGVSMVDVEEVSADVRDEYGVSASRGAFVSDLVERSSATDAGLALGDVITAVDGEAVATTAEVAEVIGDASAGDRVAITFERSGEQRTVEAVLRSRGESGG
jgi:putative serine protease PepD